MVSYTRETTNLSQLSQRFIKTGISKKDPESIAAMITLDEIGRVPMEQAIVLENISLDPGRSAYVQVIKDGKDDFNARVSRYELCYGNYNFINQDGVRLVDNLLTALVSGAEGWGAGSHPGNYIAIRTYPETNIVLFDVNHDEVMRRTLPLDYNTMTYYIAGKDYYVRKKQKEQFASDITRELASKGCRVSDGHRYLTSSGIIYTSMRSYSDGGTTISMPKEVAFPPDLIHWTNDYIKRNNISCRAVLGRNELDRY